MVGPTIIYLFYFFSDSNQTYLKLSWISDPFLSKIQNEIAKGNKQVHRNSNVDE